MKNWKIYSVVITSILVLVVIGGGIYLFANKNILTEEEAKSIAFEYANVVQENVTVLSVKKDNDDREYEIKFSDAIYIYEVDVNYNSGKINSFEKDLQNNANISNDNEIDMSEEEAKSIALNKVGLTTSDVTFTKVKIDRENGKTVYDVEFYSSTKEYDIAIDVSTKEIVSYQEDNINNVNVSTGEYIGLDKAKEIVLQHANLSSQNVVWTKAELDIDYQIATYEIEFYYNYLEYEYELDAKTGNIIKYEIDR